MDNEYEYCSLWDVTPCRFEDRIQCSRKTFYPCLKYIYTKAEAAGSSETSVPRSIYETRHRLQFGQRPKRFASNSPDFRFSSMPSDLDRFTRSDLLLIDRRKDSAGGIFIVLLVLVPLRSTHHLLTTCSLAIRWEPQSSSVRHYQRISNTKPLNHTDKSYDMQQKCCWRHNKNSAAIFARKNSVLET